MKCECCGEEFKVEHRLMCGDSTEREDVARLLAGERPCCLITDPPYGVALGSASGDTRLRISGDLNQSVIPVSFSLACEVLDDNARIYIFGGSGQAMMYFKLFDHHLHQQPSILVWVKESFVMRRNGYHSQFELCYYGWKGIGGRPDHWHSDRKQVDVWNVTRDKQVAKDHPTQKPVEVFAKPVRNSAPPGGLTLELFSGSGAHLVAAEQEGRRCCAMEISPGYVAVALERLAGMGLVPELQHE